MTNWPPAGLPRWGANTMQELDAGNRRLPRVQTSRECARERSNTQTLVRSKLNRQRSAVALWCLLCLACWESCQGRHDSMVPEISLLIRQIHLSHSRTPMQDKSVNPHRHCATDTSTRKLSNRTKKSGTRQSTFSTVKADHHHGHQHHITEKTLAQPGTRDGHHALGLPGRFEC